MEVFNSVISERHSHSVTEKKIHAITAILLNGKIEWTFLWEYLKGQTKSLERSPAVRGL